jgi:hypothetical protein
VSIEQPTGRHPTVAFAPRRAAVVEVGIQKLLARLGLQEPHLSSNHCFGDLVRRLVGVERALAHLAECFIEAAVGVFVYDALRLVHAR